MNNYGTGMTPFMYTHFLQVANNMNIYIAAAAQQHYRQRHSSSNRDRGNYWSIYSQPSIAHAGLSSLLAYGLHAIRMPMSIVRLGYRIGHFIDRNA